MSSTDRETGRGEGEARGGSETDLWGSFRRLRQAQRRRPPLEPAGRSAPLPLSFPQLQLWLLHQLDPEVPHYNVARAYRLDGPLDPARLAASLTALVGRHEALRTRFLEGGEGGAAEPVQEVVARVSLELPVVDLSRLASEGGEAGREFEREADRVLRARSRQLFDLGTAPLFRPLLVRWSPTRHGLLLSLHHIVFDGLSLAVLWRELAAVYGAADGAGPVDPGEAVRALPALGIQYPDYAAWQRRWLRAEEGGPEPLAEAVAHWRERLAGAPPLLTLPTDRPRPPVQSFRGAQRPVVIPPPVTAALKALAREQGVTLFLVLLGAFQVFLGRHAGQEDVTVGSPVANRTRAETRGLIGFFANTLALRTELDPDAPFRALLARVRDGVLGDFAHQDLPFERVVEVLAPERSRAHNPLFQTMLVLQAAMGQPALTSPRGTARGTLRPVDLGVAMFDLTLDLEEAGGALVGTLEVATDLFDRATAERFVRRLEVLLEAIAAGTAEAGGAEAGDRPLGDLPLLARGERHALTWETGPRGIPAEAPAAVHRQIFARARREPDRPALVGDDLTGARRELSYGQLAAGALRLAARLRPALGAGGDGATVGVCLPRSPEQLVAFLAVLEVGAAVLPLDPTYPEERLAFMVADSGAVLVLGAGELAARLAADAGVGLLEIQPGSAATAGGEPLPASSRSASNPLASNPLASNPLASNPSASEPPADLRPAYLIYTSGTAGRPKGVVVPHRALAVYTAWAAGCFGARRFGAGSPLGPGDRVLQFASASFDTAAEEIYPCLTSGATLVLRPEGMIDSLPVFLETAAALGVSVLDLPTAYWHELAARLAGPGVDDGGEDPFWPELHTVILGGERALPERVRAWRRLLADRESRGLPPVRLLNTYGPSETTIVATWADLTAEPRLDPEAGRPGGQAPEPPIGRAAARAEPRVVDRRLRPAPLGVSGELVVGGPGVATGYRGRPALTAERFVPDPFPVLPDGEAEGRRLYRTGDRVRRRADGALEFLGRIDGQVKIRGFRVEPAEVEAVLTAHPAVAEAAVVVPTAAGAAGPSLAAYAVLREGSDGAVGAAEGRAGGAAGPEALLLAHLAACLPEPFVPSSLTLLETLPRTPSGKVDRRGLAARQPEGPARGRRGGEAPRTPLETALAGIWCQVLGLEEVGVEESFFRLGGHSLLAGQVLARVDDRFGVRLSLRDLFDAPTVAGLAARLAGRLDRVGGGADPGGGAGAAEGAIPRRFDLTVPAAGEPTPPPVVAPPASAQTRLWFLDRLEPGSASYNMALTWSIRAATPDGPSPLSARLLERALGLLEARHAALRTRFASPGSLELAGSPGGGKEDPEPRQEIARRCSLRLLTIDLAGLPPEVAAERAAEGASALARRPFRLGRGPLVRAALWRLPAEPDGSAGAEHRLAVGIHHIVSDGWSLGILAEELGSLYRALLDGSAPGPVSSEGTLPEGALPPLPIQYADFAAWQRRRLASGALEASVDHWRRTLRDLPTVELTPDRPRPPVQTTRGAKVTAWAPPPVAEALRRLGESLGASSFMVLLAAFEMLLARHTGRTDLVLGLPVAGRDRRELEGLIGFFVDTVVLRTDLSGDPGPREVIRRVRRAALDAFAHQEVPFERLVEELQPERDLSRTPLFSIFFNMLNLTEGHLDLGPELTVRELPPRDHEAKFDLTLYASEPVTESGARAMAVDLVYNTDLFDRARMEDLARQLEGVLRQVAGQGAEEAGRPVSPASLSLASLSLASLSLVTEEASRVLPDPAAPLPEADPPPLLGAFWRQVRRRPEALALRDPTRSLTYGEAGARVAALASRLQEALEIDGGSGLGAGALPPRVILWAHRSAPLALAILAALEAGAVFVILDPAYPPGRLAAVLDAALASPGGGPAPAAWVTVPGAPEPTGELAEGLAAGRWPLVGTFGPEDLELDPDREGDQASGRRTTGRPWPADRPAYLAFTSGTTGAPRGIVGLRGALAQYLVWALPAFGVGPEDRVTLLSGLAHDPLLRDVLVPLSAGAALEVPDPERIGAPGYLASWMAERGITLAHLTPAMGELLRESVPREPDGRPAVRLDRLTRVVFGGDRLGRRDGERLRELAPGAEVWNGYGATETPQLQAAHRLAAGEPVPDPVPLGRGVGGAQLLVLASGPDGGPDSGPGPLAGVGEVGEIWLRSRHLARGYLGWDGATRALEADRFRANPWRPPTAAEPAAGPGTAFPDRLYRTGDLGRFLPDGTVRFEGRRDGQVQVRGFRVEPEEIAAVLEGHPRVLQAVVLALTAGETGTGRSELVAFAVLEDTAEAGGAREVLAHAADRLAPYAVPARLVAVAEIPLTPNGKVDRRALVREAAEAAEAAAASREPGEGGSSPRDAPRGELERRLAALWAELFGLPAVGRRDNFFDLGGHSLLAVRLMARIAEELGVALPLVILFRHQTVAGLAEALERGVGELRCR